MKILFLYFTGTYSTLSILRKLEKELQSTHQIDVIEITSNLSINNKYDYFVIFYPIYCFSAPKYVETCLKKINISSTPYSICKVSGEPYKINSASSLKIVRILNKKNNIYCHEFHLLMPYNILFRFPDNFVKYILVKDEKYLAYIANKITDNSREKYHPKLIYRFFKHLCVFQRFGAYINSSFYKIDYQKCSRCLLCLNTCPKNNIAINDKGQIIFHHSCEMCMRCSFMCPNNAISIGLINNLKVNGRYDFKSINENSSLNYNPSLEKKKFYKGYKKYFQYIDKITNSSTN